MPTSPQSDCSSQCCTVAFGFTRLGGTGDTRELSAAPSLQQDREGTRPWGPSTQLTSLEGLQRPLAGAQGCPQALLLSLPGLQLQWDKPPLSPGLSQGVPPCPAHPLWDIREMVRGCRGGSSLPRKLS